MNEDLKDFLWIPGIIALGGVLSLPPEWLRFIGVCLVFCFLVLIIVGFGPCEERKREKEQLEPYQSIDLNQFWH